jgi:hypothetical protein
LHGLDLKDAYLFGYTYTHNKQQKNKRKMIEIYKKYKIKYKTKANENKNEKILLKNLLSVYMKLDPDDQLPPSRIHKAQVLPTFK